jgi:hypothetical protein
MSKKPHPIGTTVIVVRAARVQMNPQSRVFAARISKHLDPHHGTLRYALEGHSGFAFFHRELFTNHADAMKELNDLEKAAHDEVIAVYIDAEKQLNSLKV